jgi:hypothetical protein
MGFPPACINLPKNISCACALKEMQKLKITGKSRRFSAREKRFRKFLAIWFKNDRKVMC